MRSILKGKMTYANVASTAALVIAVAGGGAATAAALIPNNSVNSAKIINNSVKSIDVKNDNLTGTDINESTLGQVPSAADAEVASGVVFGTIDDNSFDPGKIGVVRGYAWVDQASTPVGVETTLTNGYVFNAAGGPVTVTRSATGVYSVTFATNDWGPGHVQVTAYGGGSEYCKSGGWGAPSATVRCYDAAGNPANSLFDIAVIE